LARQDGKRPDGLTLIPWKCRKPMTWECDVTGAHASVTARLGGAAAEPGLENLVFKRKSF